MYEVIYADPPWAFRNVRTGGSMISGSAQKYPTLSTTVLQDLPVKTLAAPTGCTLFLWSTTAMKPEALAVMRAWGFTYKTTVYWVKTNRLGLGFWVRNQVEELLVGTRGSVRAWRSGQRNIIEAPVGAHSSKPDIFRALIEELTEGADHRIELFAREQVPGWTCAGLSLGDDLTQGATYERLCLAGQEAARPVQ